MPSARPGRLVALDWRDGRHFSRTALCVLCGSPTPLRSHQGEPAHKTCAEHWNAQHPGETRFVSDPPRRSRREHA